MLWLVLIVLLLVILFMGHELGDCSKQLDQSSVSLAALQKKHRLALIDILSLESVIEDRDEEIARLRRG